MINILLLGARRRVFFLKKLKEALNKHNYNIIYADTDHNDPMRFYADNFEIVPNTQDPKYHDEILRIATKNNIHLIIPWNDNEILKLNSERSKYEENGIKLSLPSDDTVNLFNDKFQTTKWLESLDLPQPKTILLENNENVSNVFTTLKYPFIAKPRYGQGSMGIFIIKNDEDYTFWVKNKVGDYLVQELIEGIEYTVDVCQQDNELIFHCPRRRIKTRGGESLISKTENRPEIKSLTEKICSLKKITGVYNYQVFLTKENQLYIIEFNPRFGGGSDLTIEAGGNIPKALLYMYLGYGEKLTSTYLKNNLIMTRYHSSEFFTDE